MWRCAVLKGPGSGLSRFSGGYGEGETPLPIPNREVKPLSADGTWPARARESRTPPVIPRTGRLLGGPFAVCGGPVAVCGGPFAVCGGPFAVCGGPFAVCGGPFAVCGGPFAVCGGPFAV